VTPTPPLPSWIRTEQVRGYTNAHARLGPTVTRLYGTETLYGDWGGSTLLLAKDFYRSSILDDRADEPDPYRGGVGNESKTNKILKHRLRLLGRGEGPDGFLYGSALANLLRDDGEPSGRLPNWIAARDYGVRVLREFVVPNMPRLDLIVCMGREAEKVVAVAAGIDAAVARIRRVYVPHPAAWGSPERREAEWRAAAASIA
jgi:hypothetical protein